MAGIQGTFNASEVIPKQGGGQAHPVGRFPFAISGTAIEESKEKDGGFLKVEFSTPEGKIDHRYGLWNGKSETTRRIAREQLSALCHATGIFSVDFANEAASLRGARGMIDVDYQKDSDKYMEVKLVMNSSGVAPGMSQTPPPPTDNKQVPQQGSESAPQPQQPSNPNPSANQGGWGQPQQPQQQPQQPPANAGGWQPAAGATQPSNGPGAQGWPQQGQPQGGGMQQGGMPSNAPWGQ